MEKYYKRPDFEDVMRENEKLPTVTQKINHLRRVLLDDVQERDLLVEGEFEWPEFTEDSIRIIPGAELDREKQEQFEKRTEQFRRKIKREIAFLEEQLPDDVVTRQELEDAPPAREEEETPARDQELEDATPVQDEEQTGELHTSEDSPSPERLRFQGTKYQLANLIKQIHAAYFNEADRVEVFRRILPLLTDRKGNPLSSEDAEKFNSYASQNPSYNESEKHEQMISESKENILPK